MTMMKIMESLQSHDDFIEKESSDDDIEVMDLNDL